MSNRNRPKSKKQPFIEIGYSSNLIEPDDYLDFTAEELAALSNALSLSISDVNGFINSNPPEDELKEAKEDLAIWTALLERIDKHLDFLDS